MPNRVLVLGAGFTRAFFSKAPLLLDEYNLSSLAAKYSQFPSARRILELEIKRRGDGKVDFERLITRLQGGMPYDHSRGSASELQGLLEDLLALFTGMMRDAKAGPNDVGALSELASYCLVNAVSAITFNYDDIFDRELWNLNSKRLTSNPWEPDSGYGFFCNPAYALFIAEDHGLTHPPMLLLKLHGSLNWRVKLGVRRPYSVDSLVHHEEWYQPDPPYRDARVEDHLEAAPFIIPPVLSKPDLVEQPILHLLWTKAYQLLSTANEVYFVGYSMPVTDIASGFLFREAMVNLPPTCLRVVNLATSDTSRRKLFEDYKRSFPDIQVTQFYSLGAVEWSRHFIKGVWPEDLEFRSMTL
jgi:hypothetical protein